MIASIRGPVLASGAGWVVVELGGLGMRVEVPSGRVSQAVVGDEVQLHTSLVVREDSLTLFGFGSAAELEVFERLIGVNGVGPRSALGVLSALDAGDVVRAVAAEDERPFKQVSGIGPKTAKLIVVSLAGKLEALQIELGKTGDDPGAAASSGIAADAVIEGLIGLGWNEQDAARAVADARNTGVEDEHAPLLRAALALLQRGRTGAKK